MTYTTYGGGAAYYDGYYHNPFLTALLVPERHDQPQLERYYTSPAHIVVISSYRTNYRTTAAYAREREATHAYYHQAYHTVPIVTQPGKSLGEGVTLNKGAPAAPAKVTAPPAFTPHATMPHNSTAPTHLEKSGGDLEHRDGGLFNKNTFGGTNQPKTFTPSKPSSSKPSSRSHK